MTRYLVFLQNAWSATYAGGRWPRDSWLRALARSRSGQRLRILLGEPPDWSRCFNTTPEVAAEPSGACPADPAWVKGIVFEHEPELIVTCGKQAYEALADWGGHLLALPHPAWRPLHNQLYYFARGIIAGYFDEQDAPKHMAIRQDRPHSKNGRPYGTPLTMYEIKPELGDVVPCYEGETDDANTA